MRTYHTDPCIDLLVGEYPESQLFQAPSSALNFPLNANVNILIFTPLSVHVQAYCSAGCNQEMVQAMAKADSHV